MLIGKIICLLFFRLSMCNNANRNVKHKDVYLARDGESLAFKSFKNYSLKRRNRNEAVPEFVPSKYSDFVSSDVGQSYTQISDTNTKTLPLESSNKWTFRQDVSNHPDGNSYPVPEDRLPNSNGKTTEVHHKTNDNSLNLDSNHLIFEEGDSWKENIRKKRSTKWKSPQKSVLSRYQGFFNRQGYDGNTDYDNVMNWPESTSTTDLLPRGILDMIAGLSGIENRNDMMYFEEDESFLSKILNDPVPIMIAAFLPISIILMAVLPVLMGNLLKTNNDPPPSVSTTATGPTNSKTLANSTHLFAPILDAISTFTPRSDDSKCAQKEFCEALKANKFETQFLQKAVREIARYIDEFWLDSFDLKPLLQSLKDGKCERITCLSSAYPIQVNTTSISENSKVM